MTRRVKSLFILIFVVCLAAQAFAEDRVRVTTIFDRRTVDVNDEIKLTIKIVGAKSNVLRPRVPHLDSFDSFYTGRSNQFTFVNGRSENTTAFSYVLIPKRAGKFALPPIEVDVDNTIFRTEPIDLEVTGASGGTPSPQGPGPSPYAQQPQAPFAGQGAPPAAGPTVRKPSGPATTQDTEKDIFLVVTPDKTTAYPNEQIVLTYSLYTRVSARPEQFEKDPNLNGFWVEEVPIERDYQPEKVIHNGLQYLKADMRRVAIFPTTTGTFEIDPGVFRATVKKEGRPSSVFDDFLDESFFGGGFFTQREQKLLTAPPVKIAVRPLPQEGKPAGFSGVVGQFRMNSTIDRRTVKQNEPIILNISIEGEGNIEMVERPKIPDLKDVKVYDSDSSTDLEKTRAGVRGRKNFEVTMIPTAAGDFEIPALEFHYLDPLQNAYKTLKTTPYPIKVQPGPAVPLSEALSKMSQDKEAKKKIELESTDIHFIKEKAKFNRVFGLEAANGLLLSLDMVLGLSALFLWVRRRYDEVLDQNLALKRSRFAPKYVQDGIRRLRKLSSSRDGNQKKFFEEAQKVMNSYFADKFNLSAQGLTFPAVESRLIERGIDPGTLESLRAFYETTDRVRFTSADVPQVRYEELLGVINRMVQFLEKR